MQSKSLLNKLNGTIEQNLPHDHCKFLKNLENLT